MRLNLTEKGQEILFICNNSIDELENSLFGGLNNEEIDLYRKLMGKILETAKV